MADPTIEVDGLDLTPADNDAGWKFVSHTQSGRWQAKPTLRKGGGQQDLGSFDSPLDAAKAVARAFKEMEEGTFQAKEKQARQPKGEKRKRCAHARCHDASSSLT